MLVAAGVIYVKVMIDHGFSCRAAPTSAEALIARTMRNMAIPRSFASAKDPIPSTAEVLDRARAHFADHCASCHGNDGRGKTTIGRNLYPKPPDMTAEGTQELSDGQLFYIIKNGVRLTGMPAWGEDTPADDRQTWELVRFIRHLPELTEKEQAEMEDLNPKSPEE